MFCQETVILVFINVFKIVAPLTVLALTFCAKKATAQEKRSEKPVLAPKSLETPKKEERPKTPEKEKSPAKKSSKKKIEKQKMDKKQVQPPPMPRNTGNDGHKSIEEAVAEGLILDPTPFKNEGNLDLRSPMHPKFGLELQQLIDNPPSCETSDSSCSDENRDGKRVVVHPSQCKVFETTNNPTEPMSSH